MESCLEKKNSTSHTYLVMPHQRLMESGINSLNLGKLKYFSHSHIMYKEDKYGMVVKSSH
jgi:hypothetical protein